MKKFALSTYFSQNLHSLILSMGIIVFTTATTSVIADPIKDTAIARGTLSGIVDINYPNSKLSKAQIMIAILAKNPSAFRGGNINFMLRNKELLLPSEPMIAGIPAENADVLLLQHNRFYRRGKTGNLSPPTFINSGGDPAALEKLKTQHSAQTVRVEALSEESTKLQGLVQRLEAEKDKRDEELRELEEKIQALKESGGKSLPGEESANEQRLKDKNAALQQRLVESKSELAENNLTTISLERRVIELQDEKQQTQAQDQNAPDDSTQAADLQENNFQQQTDTDTIPATEVLDAPSTDLNGNIISPTESSTGFDLGKLTWLLPLLAILVGLGFLLRRFFAGKKHEELNLDDVDDLDLDFTTPKMRPEDRADYQQPIAEPTEEESLETSIKLDVARAYMEAEDNQSAYEMLHEVLREGSIAQQDEANQLLVKL
jgi:FimV-like protein